MLETLMRNNDKVEQDWVEKGLPKLVDEYNGQLRTVRRHGPP